jgi:hypothetical protein
MTIDFAEHDEFVLKLNSLVEADREELIQEIADEYERREPSGREAFWSADRSSWAARGVLDAGEPVDAMPPPPEIDGSVVLRLPVEQVSVWDRRDLLRD